MSHRTREATHGPFRFRLRGYYPLWRLFPVAFGYLNGVRGLLCREGTVTLTTPRVQRLQPITHPWFRLFPVRSPLLGESLLISFPPGTEMFQFPGFASCRLCVQRQMTDLSTRRVSPFGHPRIQACLAAPRGFSQPSTSFIAGRCQGIHRTPLFA